MRCGPGALRDGDAELQFRIVTGAKASSSKPRCSSLRSLGGVTKPAQPRRPEVRRSRCSARPPPSSEVDVRIRIEAGFLDDGSSRT